MFNDIFAKYSSREINIFKLFLEENKWFSDLILDFRSDNTGFHDLKARLKDGKTLIIQIKEDEAYWFNKTGNLGFDLISAFTFKGDQQFWLQNNYWVKPEQTSLFFSSINILKWGKLITCDADVHIFYVKDKLCRMFDNSKLQDKEFKKNLLSNYSIRINKKIDYNLQDEWQSCAYFIRHTDIHLAKTEILSVNSLLEAINTNNHSVDRTY